MRTVIIAMMFPGLTACATQHQGRAATTGAVIGAIARAVVGAASAGPRMQVSRFPSYIAYQFPPGQST